MRKIFSTIRAKEWLMQKQNEGVKAITYQYDYTTDEGIYKNYHGKPLTPALPLNNSHSELFPAVLAQLLMEDLGEFLPKINTENYGCLSFFNPLTGKPQKRWTKNCKVTVRPNIIGLRKILLKIGFVVRKVLHQEPNADNVLIVWIIEAHRK